MADRVTHLAGTRTATFIVEVPSNVALPLIIVYQIAGGKITGFNLAIDQMDLMKQFGVTQ